MPELKGVQAKMSPIEISAPKLVIYSLLDNFCVSNVKANIPGEKWIHKLIPYIDEPDKSSLF